MRKTVFKEDLSMAYLRAVAAMAEVECEFNGRDVDGSDATSKKLIPDGNYNRWMKIDVQLKSTSSVGKYSINDDCVKYELRGKNYNDFLDKRVPKLILMVLILPENKADWTKFSEKEMILRNCMYWSYMNIGGAKVNPDSTKTISIPRENLVNPDSLLQILKDRGA